LAAIETNYWVQRAIRTFSDLTANILGEIECGMWHFMGWEFTL